MWPLSPLILSSSTKPTWLTDKFLCSGGKLSIVYDVSVFRYARSDQRKVPPIFIKFQIYIWCFGCDFFWFNAHLPKLSRTATQLLRCYSLTDPWMTSPSQDLVRVRLQSEAGRLGSDGIYATGLRSKMGGWERWGNSTVMNFTNRDGHWSNCSNVKMAVE